MPLQDVIDASITGSGAHRVGDRIDLGKEVIDLDDTLEVAQSVNGMHLRGRGRATRFRWVGPDDRPVFRFTDGNGCAVSDVMVELVNPALTLVQMLDSGSGPIRSSHNTLRNIFVPDASGKLGTFLLIGGGVDQKNDFMRGENLDVAGCEIGLVVEGRQALNHELSGCQVKGRTAGRTGIRTSNGGSVRVFGGSLIQFTESAFAIDTRNGVALTAYGVHVESCGRLLTAPSPNPPDITTHTVILDGLRWGSPSGGVASDGEIIAYSGGSLVVRGCWFGTGKPEETVYRFRTTRPSRSVTSSSRTVACGRPTRPGIGRGGRRGRWPAACCTSSRAENRSRCRGIEPPEPGGEAVRHGLQRRRSGGAGPRASERVRGSTATTSAT